MAPMWLGKAPLADAPPRTMGEKEGNAETVRLREASANLMLHFAVLRAQGKADEALALLAERPRGPAKTPATHCKSALEGGRKIL